MTTQPDKYAMDSTGPPDPLSGRLAVAIGEARGLYHRLVLLVGGPATGKTDTLRALAQSRGWPLVNVNQALSERLLELTSKQRALRVARLLAELADAQVGEVLLLDNTELLFSRELQQDPLRLLQGLARNRVVVASWRGCMDGTRLTFAEPSHPEYQRYESPQAMLVQAGRATENPG